MSTLGSGMLVSRVGSMLGIVGRMVGSLVGREVGVVARVVGVVLLRLPQAVRVNSIAITRAMI